MVYLEPNKFIPVFNEKSSSLNVHVRKEEGWMDGWKGQLWYTVNLKTLGK